MCTHMSSAQSTPGHDENKHRVIAQVPNTPENKEQLLSALIYYMIETDTL